MILVFAGLLLCVTAPCEAIPAETYRLLNLLTESFRKIRDNAAVPVSDETLVEGAIQGMLQTVDARSRLLPAGVYENLQTHVGGSFGGIGVELTEKEGRFFISRVLEGGPAATAGLQIDDEVMCIGEDDLKGYTLEETVHLLKGPKGEKVKLSLKREGKDLPDVLLIKDVIALKTVESQLLEGGMGYVHIASFNNKNTADLVRDAVKDLEEKSGGVLEGLILDLRDNGGGLFNQALEVSNLFLENVEITTIKGRTESDTRKYKAGKGALLKNVPLAVLVNGGTASAAEIVAGALLDHKRAYLMGEKTLGKASVQTVFPLQYGEEALNLTTQHYYTPDGKNIDQNGITPHSECNGAACQDENLKKQALTYLKQYKHDNQGLSHRI